MPIFEYECRGCGQQFEHLSRADQTPSCPSCSGLDLQKRFSAFAVSANGSPSPRESSEAGGGCGMCGDPRGPGACSMN
jgi:putative FmdB family regulatory protein